MFSVSVKNLYISKLGIKIMSQNEKGKEFLEPATLVGEVFFQFNKNNSLEVDQEDPGYPDYMQIGYYDSNNKTFCIGGDLKTHKIYITGYPLIDSPLVYAIEDRVLEFSHIYRDSYRNYLIQVVKI